MKVSVLIFNEVLLNSQINSLVAKNTHYHILLEYIMVFNQVNRFYLEQLDRVTIA